MTEAERQLIADLTARIARLERWVADLDPRKPVKTSLTCEAIGYRKRDDEA